MLERGKEKEDKMRVMERDESPKGNTVEIGVIFSKGR